MAFSSEQRMTIQKPAGLHGRNDARAPGHHHNPAHMSPFRLCRNVRTDGESLHRRNLRESAVRPVGFALIRAGWPGQREYLASTPKASQAGKHPL